MKEAFAALLIEISFSKEEILELYLNEVFLAQEGRLAIHGFAEAAKRLFGKEVEELSLAESATLAGMVKAPSYYSPRRHPKRAAARRATVLAAMKESGFITTDEAEQAKGQKLTLVPRKPAHSVAAHYRDHIRKILSDTESPSLKNRKSVKILTGLDVEYQKCARQAVSKGVADIVKRGKAAEKELGVALVSVVPGTGEFRAWVGGQSYGHSQFDTVSQAVRQPGSAFKPVVYLTALDPSLNQYKAARTTDVLRDEPLRLSDKTTVWQPQNYSREYSGDVTLRYALSKSLNVPAVELALKVGLDSVQKTTRLLGVKTDIPRLPSIALGSVEMSPLTLSRIYATIANGGLETSFRPYVAIIGPDGNPLSVVSSQEQRLFDAGPVFLLSDMLRSVVESGTAMRVKSYNLASEFAGKTGTTNGGKDAWFVGFSPKLLTTVWVGSQSNKDAGLLGSQDALPIWGEYQRCIAPMQKQAAFTPPPSVVYKRIDTQSGGIATGRCPAESVVQEVFLRSNAPEQPCHLHDGSSGRRGDLWEGEIERSQKRKNPVSEFFRNLWE